MDVNNSVRKQRIPNHLLRKAREARGWSHRDVADRMNLPDSHTVGRWERGDNMPGPHYRQELCRIFGKSLAELGLLKVHSDEDDPVPIQHKPARRTDNYTQIPPVFSSFVGREHEVAEICERLTRSPLRLLTLLGPGGVGKTRLSIEVAQQVRDHFADGVCFVSLAALRDPAQVILAIAEALSIEGREGLPPIEQLKTILQEKHLLLLLDNFEHVIPAAPFIEDLLGYCLHVKVLITSREALRLSAEQVYPLSPLPVPDLNRLPMQDEPEAQLHYAAVALFVQRAQTLQPDFQVTANNVEAIATLCVRLDGLPLAIELAAARINLLPPHVLLTRLSSVLHALKNHRPTAPERHHTLYQTVKWSYDLLTEEEQWLFRHLSVFIGGATLSTVEAFFDADEQPSVDVMELVDSLVNKSLLQSTERESKEPRFVMLEMIREYGLQCLKNAHEWEESQRRYALYFLAEVEEAAQHLKGAQQTRWLWRLEREVENLRAALGWFIQAGETEHALRFCEAFGKFCGLRGYWSEEQRWLQAALALPQTPASRAIRARVLRRAGHLAYRLRNLPEARTLLEESIRSSREVGDQQNLAGALGGLGRVLARKNNVAAADRLFQESVQAARQSGDNWAIANALESRGKFLCDRGEINGARALLEESLMLARTLDKESLARILTTLVTLEVADGNMLQAETLAQESFALAQQLGTRPLIALALDSLGEISLLKGAYEQAKQRFELRITMARELGDTPTVTSRLLKIADIALAQGDIIQATALAEENLPRLRELTDTSGVITALCIVGDSKRLAGDTARAIAVYREALMLQKKAGNKRNNIVRCLIGLTRCMFDQEQLEYASYLSGCVTAHLRSSRHLYPLQRADYATACEKAQSLLAQERFAQASHKGQIASLEEIIAIFNDQG